MTAFISAVAWLLAATGLVLIGAFLNRMVKPISRAIAAYCEHRAERSISGMVDRLVESTGEEAPISTLTKTAGCNDSNR